MLGSIKTKMREPFLPGEAKYIPLHSLNPISWPTRFIQFDGFAGTFLLNLKFPTLGHNATETLIARFVFAATIRSLYPFLTFIGIRVHDTDNTFYFPFSMQCVQNLFRSNSLTYLTRLKRESDTKNMGKKQQKSHNLAVAVNSPHQVYISDSVSHWVTEVTIVNNKNTT